MTHFYSLRSADGSFRIQKFDADLNPMFDSSYLLSEVECSCPAGHRPVCRHRQMLAKMLELDLLDSPDFYDYGRGIVHRIGPELLRIFEYEGDGTVLMTAQQVKDTYGLIIQHEPEPAVPAGKSIEPSLTEPASKFSMEKVASHKPCPTAYTIPFVRRF